MARLAAVENTLYYPTPTHLIIELFQRLTRGPLFNHGKITVFDPCAGEGHAVIAVADNLLKIPCPNTPAPWCLDNERNSHVNIHAVELDITRANRLADNLLARSMEDRSWQGPAERFRLLPNHRGETPGYEVVFLNPPYDYGQAGRMELDWIRLAAHFLAKEGTMILVLPDMFSANGRYANAMAATLKTAGLFSNGCYRFPEPEYHAFHQFIMIARKTGWNNGCGSLELIDWHNPNGRAYITCTPTNFTRHAEMMPIPLAQPSLVAENVPASLHHLFGNPTASTTFTPLMRMRTEHAGLIAAAGMLNGTVVDNKALRGATIKREISTSESYLTDSGKTCTVTTTTEVMAAQLTLLDLATATLTTANSLDNPDAFEALFLSHAQHMVDVTQAQFPPSFEPDVHYPNHQAQLERCHAPRRLPDKPDQLFEPQLHRAAAILHLWEHEKTATLVGKMSTGKTSIALAASAVAASRRKPHNQKVIVLLPAQKDLTDKWAQEIATVLQDFHPTIVKASKLSEIREAFDTQGMVYVLLTETMAKISSGWGPIPDARRCPACGSPFTRTAHQPVKNTEELKPHKLKTFCARCDTPLWTVTRRTKPADKNADEDDDTPAGNAGWARYPLARYIRDHFQGRYILIADECHNYKGADTARAMAAQDLMTAAWRALQMTGTLYNGYASSLFYLLWRANHSFRALWPYNSVRDFIKQFGLWETTTRTYREKPTTSAMGYNQSDSQKTEKPGINPLMATLLLPSSAFIDLADLRLQLPPVSEHTLFVDPPEHYARPIIEWLSDVRQAATDAFAHDGDNSLLAQFTHAKNGVWDIMFAGDSIANITISPIPSEKPWPKEEAFLRIIADNKRQGRPVLCFVAQINRRDCTSRLCSLLTQYGMKGAVMRSDVKLRLPFIRDAIAGGADVIFTSAVLVKEGIDIIETPTVIWYGPEFNTYLIPQANARPLRLSQTKPVAIWYLAYNQTNQAEAMNHIATKLGAAQALHGDPRSGLADILGEADFITRFQALTVTSTTFSSSMQLEQLPPLEVFRPRETPPPPPPRPAQVPPRLTAIYIDKSTYQQLSLFG